MTLTILIALMSAFREAQADESVMISFSPYSPECVEGVFSEVVAGIRSSLLLLLEVGAAI
jgi:hypothetical protein